MRAPKHSSPILVGLAYRRNVPSRSLADYCALITWQLHC